MADFIMYSQGEEQTPGPVLDVSPTVTDSGGKPHTFSLAGQFLVLSKSPCPCWQREPSGWQAHGDRTLAGVYNVTVHAISAKTIAGLPEVA